MTNFSSAASLPKPRVWTRSGFVEMPWSKLEKVESLIFDTELRDQIQKLGLGFVAGEEVCRKLSVPWRRGLFLSGAAGTGKSAVARTLSLLTGFQLTIIPENEIIDTHAALRALSEISTTQNQVVVFDHFEEAFLRLESQSFFSYFDEVSLRLDGMLWMVTSRKPENLPKSLLIRPGRFEEVIKLHPPTADLKTKYYEQFIVPVLKNAIPEEGFTLVQSEHLDTLTSNSDLTYSHLEELRLLCAKVLMDGSSDGLVDTLNTYARELRIEGERMGGLNPLAIEIENRIRLTDQKLIVAALDVTSAFKKVIEATTSATMTETLAIPEKNR